MQNKELIEKIDCIHTTLRGENRIRRNLHLLCSDVVAWCKEKICEEQAVITRKGKNYYIDVNGAILTINAYRYTIITAHKKVYHT